MVVNGQTRTSDAEGRAAFEVAAGEYDITAEAAGHLPTTRHVAITAEGPLTIRIELSRIPEAEETVIVSATISGRRGTLP